MTSANKQFIGAYIDKQIVKEIGRLAKKERRSVSNVLAVLLESVLKSRKENQPLIET